MAFYTYLWLREDGRPYYVGKGKGNRAFNWHKRVRTPPRDRIIIQEHLSEADAFAAEMFLIAFYGRKDLKEGCLVNLTNGGEGPAGQVMSPEWCERNREMSRCRPRQKMAAEAIERMRKRLTGRKMSASFCEKNRARMLANNPFKGRTHSEETRAKMAEQGKRRAQTSEFKEMMRLAGEKGRVTRWRKR